MRETVLQSVAAMVLSNGRSRLTVFCGKGGVGKTTLSLAHGFRRACEGLKTLVVTSHPLPELAVCVSLHGLKARYPQAAANLLVVHIDPREILANKVKQQVPSDFLARGILSSQLYQNIIEVAPGLKEVAFLARLKQLADRRGTGDKEAYDLLIWDAPATGHFLQTLKVARNFDTYLSGPFALLGRELQRYFSDPASIDFLPVAILEEMAVEETIELCRELEGTLQVHPSAILCNMVSPLLALDESDFKGMYEHFASESMNAPEVRFALERHMAERDLYGRLRLSMRAPLHAVPRVPAWASDLDLVVALSGALPDIRKGAAT